jgi:hypothetical protein
MASNTQTAKTSPTKDYKATAKKYKTLYDKEATLRTESEAKHTEWRKSVKEKMDISKKANDDLRAKCQEMEKALEEKDTIIQQEQDRVKHAEVFIKACQELTGKSTADEVFAWMESAKCGEDATRMFGELQVKYNLLNEKLDFIHKNGYKVAKSTAKSKKGLSTTHRKEDVGNGVLRCFQKDRCCAVVWANGLAQQCSRHWNSKDNPEGLDTKLCKTHNKKINDQGQFTGSWGLYHQERPTNWGEWGLDIQNEWKKSKGKPICYKMKEDQYTEQFNSQAFQESIPEGWIRYDYPEKQAEVPLANEDGEFSSDDEDDDAQTIGFSDEEEQQAVEEQAVEEPVAVEPAVEIPVEFPKQAQLDQLEQLNSGAFAMDADILEDLREEKKEWEAEQGQSDEEIICQSCSVEVMSSACKQWEGEMLCPECHKEAEYKAENDDGDYNLQLADSDDEM